MLCYKDMTFCKYYTTCKEGRVCHRRLTQYEKHKAILSGLDICQYFAKPKCYKKKRKI